jgi:hypothetical protein
MAVLVGVAVLEMALLGVLGTHLQHLHRKVTMEERLSLATQEAPEVAAVVVGHLPLVLHHLVTELVETVALEQPTQLQVLL